MIFLFTRLREVGRLLLIACVYMHAHWLERYYYVRSTILAYHNR
jgi:hypothetical protein